jgi:CDP-paratose 2-epimerase
MTGAEYTVLGYQGKQVRDNLHAADLVNMFWHFCRQPRPGEVYNVGGSRHANCSMLEAIRLCEELTGKKLKSAYHPTARTGDHIWYVSDVRKFQNHYPDWAFAYDLNRTLEEIVDAIAARL